MLFVQWWKAHLFNHALLQQITKESSRHIDRVALEATHDIAFRAYCTKRLDERVTSAITDYDGHLCRTINHLECRSRFSELIMQRLCTLPCSNKELIWYMNCQPPLKRHAHVISPTVQGFEIFGI